MSRPRKLMSPWRSAFSGSRLRIDIAVTLLPEPDSPTSATVVFSGTSKLTPFTASNRLTTPSTLPRRNATRRSLIDSSIWLFQSAQLRIERIAQRVGHQRERRHEHRHEDRRGGQLPPVAEDQLALRLRQHRSPRHLIDADTQPEVRQDDFRLDEAHDQDRQLHENHMADVRQDVA